MHERVDYGLAAIRATLAGGKIRDHLPPWYDQPGGLDDDELWAMLDSMTGRKYPEVKPSGR